MHATSRRRFLRGAGGIAIGLPFLESLAPRRAHAQAAKKRLIVFFTPEGTRAKEFYPTGSETSFQLGPISMPLEPFKKDLLFFQGINHQSCKDVGSDHFKSMVHMLTGGSGDSIDQIVASRVGKGWRFPSLQFAVKPRNVNEKGVIAYTGGKMVQGEFSPVKMFARMFAGGAVPGASVSGGTPPALSQVFARRKSVVDFVKDQIETTRALLGKDDRARLDEHLGAIREVEASLTTPPPAVNADCGNPKVELIDGPNTGGAQPFDKLTDVQMELLVLAIACQLTPVASLQLSNSGSGEPFAFLGVPSGRDILHGWVHNDGGHADFPEYARKAFTWFAGRFAHLLGRLQSIDDGGRPLLDSCAVVWCSHFGNGGAHSPVNVPWVLAGRAGGALKPGRSLDFTASPQPHNRLLIGIAQAMGVSLDKLGNEKYGTSPLPGML